MEDGLDWLDRRRGASGLIPLDINVSTTAAGIGDGRWHFASIGLKKESVIYSVGIGNDISFESGLIQRFGCEIHAFDPTSLSRQWLSQQKTPKGFHAHPWGLAHFDGEANFRLPPTHSISFSLCPEVAGTADHRAEVRRLSTLRNALGHAHIDLLKIDIEGAEFEVIDDLVSEAPHIRQLLIEFHARLRSKEGEALTYKAIEKLRGAGYRLFHVSRRQLEFGFIN